MPNITKFAAAPMPLFFYSTHTMRYKAVFLDFDDTLYDTHGNAQIALEGIFEEFELGRHFDAPSDFFIPYWKTNAELWAQYAKAEISRDYLIVERFRRPLSLGRGLEPDEAYCLRISDRFLEICAEQSGTIEGAHELVADLKAKGYRLFIASNGFTEVQSRKIASAGMAGCFEKLFLSEALGVNKPSPLFFERALKEAGLEATEVMMIGDNYDTDILGAINSGMHSIHFNPGGTMLEEGKKAPDHSVRSLRDIMEIL